MFTGPKNARYSPLARWTPKVRLAAVTTAARRDCFARILVWRSSSSLLGLIGIAGSLFPQRSGGVVAGP